MRCVLMFALSSVALAQETPDQVFQKRILPIFKSPNPSSCVQCHLAGVDLKNYILPSAEKTFVSLRDQGLVNLEDPSASKILALIKMGEGDKGASLIQEKARKAEYEAFAAWLAAASKDPKLRDAPKLADSAVAKPARPVEVIRHARIDSLQESFERNIWANRFRCMNCHIEGSREGEKNRKDFGDRTVWFKKEGPKATMDYIIASKLIDVKAPTRSTLLLKPLNAVKHGGGKKFVEGDLGYKAFRAWIEDYAAITADKYKDAKSLPPADPRRRFGSEIWLKVINCDPAWDGKLMQASVYAFDAASGAYEKEPIAVSDRQVNGKARLWQHTLVLEAAPGSDRDKAWSAGPASLPAGKYRVDLYVDRTGRTARDWKAVLKPEDLIGSVEIDARWADGYNRMTVADAAKARK